MSASVDSALDRLHRHNAWFRHESGQTADRTSQRAADIAGIRVTGYVSDESGWGAAGRGYVRALQRLHVPMTVHDVSALTTNRSEDRSLRVDSTAIKTDVNLVCVDAGQHFALLSEVGESFFEGHYNIGAWAWELPRFPERWYDRFAYYDEIWVGTSFIASALAPIAPVPVVRVPPVINVPPASRARGRQRLGAADGEFIFVFVFDVHSHLQRKNPHAAIAAFRRAFDGRDDVRLVLKSVNASADPAGYADVRARAAGARIDVLDGYWQAHEVRDLMAACDAYVSLHRSEGTGLTIAEAMALARPVIATDWSGNTDFADASNSYPVGYALETIERNVGPYRAGETWAEPDVEHAAWLMRHVVANPDEAHRRGLAARTRMRQDYCEDAIAALVRSRLDVVASRHRLSVLRQEMSTFVRGYRSLVQSVRQILAQLTTADDVVAIVSRGDADLLALEHGTGWHFPEARPGVYAGHHPEDSAAAIASLDDSRARGATLLVFPGTAFWWLDHYAEFRDHLERQYRCAWRDAQCVIYDLRTAPSEGVQ